MGLQITLTISTMGIGPTTAICPKHFCVNGGFGAFQHPSHPELVHYLAPALSLPAESPAVSESADVEDSSETSGKRENYYFSVCKKCRTG